MTGPLAIYLSPSLSDTLPDPTFATPFWGLPLATLSLSFSWPLLSFGFLLVCVLAPQGSVSLEGQHPSGSMQICGAQATLAHGAACYTFFTKVDLATVPVADGGATHEFQLRGPQAAGETFYKLQGSRGRDIISHCFAAGQDMNEDQIQSAW